jgi:Protein of unknown function (DUF3047)
VRMLKYALAAFALFVLGTRPLPASAKHLLADPAAMMQTAKRVDFVGRNTFSRELSEYGPVLLSEPHDSASGLYLPVAIDPGTLGPVSWRWRVGRLQLSADVRSLKKEDFGAVIFFIFGEPSFFDRDVPTLAYTWTATPVADGTVLCSLRYQSLRFIQLRGRAEVGAWELERRDLAADYKRIFGRDPPTLRYVAVFNDNDQTGEPASAEFGPVESER